MPASCALSIAITIAGTIVTPGSRFARSSASIACAFPLPRASSSRHQIPSAFALPPQHRLGNDRVALDERRANVLVGRRPAHHPRCQAIVVEPEGIAAHEYRERMIGEPLRLTFEARGLA